MVNVDLIPNGSKMEVNKDNKEEYVNKYVQYLTGTSVERQYQAFKRGFMTIAGGPVLLVPFSHYSHLLHSEAPF